MLTCDTLTELWVETFAACTDSTEELVAWAAAPLPGGDAASATQRVRRYAAPFVQWLQSAPVEELAPAA